MSPRRLVGVLLLLVVPFVAGCGAGSGNETEKIRTRPYAGSADAGDIAVRAVRIVPALTSTTGPGATQGYLTMSLINRGQAADSLTNATVAGATVQPASGTSSLTVEPQRTLRFGAPALGDTGPALEISGLATPLRPGTVLEATVTFQDAGTVQVVAPVEDPFRPGSTATSEPIRTTGSYPSAAPPSGE